MNRRANNLIRFVGAGFVACMLLLSGCAAKKGALKAEDRQRDGALSLFREGVELLFEDNQKALVKFDQAREVDPSLVAAHFNAGLALEALGNMPEAALRYQACLAQKKESPNCSVNLLLVKAKMGQVSAAEELANHYVAEYPESPFVQSAVAHLALYQKDFVRAEQLARQAIERDAENIEALYVMARVFFAQKKWAAAKWVIKNALEIAPSHGGLYLLLGHTEKELDLLHDALDAYGLAVKFHPTDEALESYGLLLLKRGRAVEALSVLERLVALRPNEYKNHLHVGNAYMANKRFELAQGAYVKALELKPDDKDINFNLGLLFYDMKPEGMPELDRLKTSLEYFKSYLLGGGLSKDKTKEVNEYLDVLKQKIEFEEYKKASEAEAAEAEAEPDSETPPQEEDEKAKTPQEETDEGVGDLENNESEELDKKKPKKEDKKPVKKDIIDEEEEDFFE